MYKLSSIAGTTKKKKRKSNITANLFNHKILPQILMKVWKIHLLVLSTQIATILVVVLLARVWKDFLEMVSFAMVSKVLSKMEIDLFTHTFEL